MKKTILSGLFIFYVLLFFGCAETQKTAGKRTAAGAAIGAATGAVAGAVIGHQSGHRTEGAVIGAVAGAALGGAVGYQLDKQAKELEQIPNTDVKREPDRLVVTMAEEVLFDFDSAALKVPARETIASIAEVMVKYPDNNVLVKGHTDNKGIERYNQELSERRAKSVRNYIIVEGVSIQRITAIGFGETMPIASNDTPDGRQKNRRVEIEIRPTSVPAS